VSNITTIELPSVPESYNKTRYAHWSVAYRAASRLREDIGYLLLASNLPRHLASVEAEAVLIFPTKRKRDEGNFRTPLEKALGDALTQGGFLEDDTPDQYRFGGLTFSPERGGPASIITLRWQR
jgi:hypothetical protein